MPDIDAIIKTAKLGRERKRAQVDTCTVFAAALYDVLIAQRVQCRMVTVVSRGLNQWAHAVVEVGGRYYDSMGEFSVGIYRARAGIHPAVTICLDYRDDSRHGCFESDFDELHVFFINALSRAIRGATAKAA